MTAVAPVVAEGGGRAALAPAIVALTRRMAPGDGVALAGELARRALATLCAREPAVVDLGVSSAQPVGAARRAAFAAELAARQAAGAGGWVMFNHVGIARAQRAIPARWRLPYAVFAHGIDVWGDALTADRMRVLRDARVALASSAYTARRVAREHPEAPPLVACPLALLPDAPRADLHDPAVESLPPRSVLVVGRMSASERYKGHDQLVECWPDVLRRVPDAVLICVGRGDDVDRLRAKALAAGVGDAVRFTGFVSDEALEGMFRRAAMLAMPSLGEGFGFVYLQAMRAGLPCLSTPDDAAADIVLDGRTGLHARQDERARLADAIARCLEDPELRHRLGAAGRERFEREYTFDAFCRRLRDALGGAFPARGGH